MKRSAFTLVELVISLGLVLVLMLGITKVFSLTSQTSNATQAFSTGTRDGRSAQSVLYQDIAGFAADAPFMIIRSRAVQAYNSTNDEKADIDKSVNTIDVNGDGDETDANETIPATATNFRNHRTDILAFFSRGKFQRQTGNGPPLLADQYSREAMIWLGHLDLPGNAAPAVYYEPGDPAIGNLNNRYASQWILGRVATLLVQPSATGAVLDNAKIGQAYYFRPTAAAKLEPLMWDTTANSAAQNTIQSCRYDVAGTTMADYKQDLQTWITAHPSPNSSDWPWWSRMMGGNMASETGANKPGRYQANKFVVMQQGVGITPLNFAQHAPIFMERCTQFVVEFAGDYVTQDSSPLLAGGINPNPNYGQITDTTKGDGMTDFFVLDPGTERARGAIRYYGFPRDSTNDGKIIAANGDVVPVRDLVGGTPKSFEKFGLGAETFAQQADYSTLVAGKVYTCAWGPTEMDQRPKMIRIIASVVNDDQPTSDGQQFQWVFNLP